jgi:tripartite-type tricarboxylate transporter receptor subunit TctC
VNEILRIPKVREALANQGLSARGGSPAELAQLIARDGARWAKVVKEAKIAPSE